MATNYSLFVHVHCLKCIHGTKIWKWAKQIKVNEVPVCVFQEKKGRLMWRINFLYLKNICEKDVITYNTITRGVASEVHSTQSQPGIMAMEDKGLRSIPVVCQIPFAMQPTLPLHVQISKYYETFFLYVGIFIIIQIRHAYYNIYTWIPHICIHR